MPMLSEAGAGHLGPADYMSRIHSCRSRHLGPEIIEGTGSCCVPGDENNEFPYFHKIYFFPICI